MAGDNDKAVLHAQQGRMLDAQWDIMLDDWEGKVLEDQGGRASEN